MPLSTSILVHLILFLFILLWTLDIFLIESWFWSLLILCTRVENLEPSHVLFPWKDKGVSKKMVEQCGKFHMAQPWTECLIYISKVSWNSWIKWEVRGVIFWKANWTKQNSGMDRSEFKCAIGTAQDLFSRVENRSILNIWPTSLLWSPADNNLSDTSIVNYSSRKRDTQ